jgi:predicted thioesterase
MYDNKFDFRGALRDWHDFDKTDRKVIARRRLYGALPQSESAAMQAAKEMLDEGLISIVTKVTANAFGRGHTVTYIAERVK